MVWCLFLCCVDYGGVNVFHVCLDFDINSLILSSLLNYVSNNIMFHVLDVFVPYTFLV